MPKYPNVMCDEHGLSPTGYVTCQHFSRPVIVLEKATAFDLGIALCVDCNVKTTPNEDALVLGCMVCVSKWIDETDRRSVDREVTEHVLGSDFEEHGERRYDE